MGLIPTRILVWPIAAGLAVVTAITAGAARAPQQTQTRDSGRTAATGAASIAGTVTIDDPGSTPLRRARVMLTATDTGTSRSVFTDDAGRFSMDGLAAGKYTLSATKGGYVRMAYGAKRYDRPGTTVVLTEGQRMPGLSMRLPRGSVVTGIITDETGQPAFGTQVRLMRWTTQAGERTLTGVGINGGLTNDATDDRGGYRFYGLPAGEYVVVAMPRIAANGEVRAMTDAEIRAAMATLQQPASLAAGGRGAAAPPPPMPEPERINVAQAAVFFPGTTSGANAATIAVGAGEERSGVDFALQLVRTAKIEGVVTTPAGVAPQSVQLTLLPGSSQGAGAANLGMAMINRTSVGPDGKFSYTGVAPGQYIISARSSGGGGRQTMSFGGGNGDTTMVFTTAVAAGGPVGRGGGMGAMEVAAPAPGAGGPALWGQTEVNIDGQNLTNVSVTMQPGMTLTGRLVFEGVKMQAPTDFSRSTIGVSPVTSGGMMVSVPPPATIDATGRFTITGLTPGKYRFNAFVGSPGSLGQWTLKSAVAGERDALDLPLEIAPNEEISNAVLTFTDATQEVSGMLQDAAGRAAPDFTIVVFAADSKFWTTPTRRVRMARPSTDGRFTVTGLPAGTYRIAALTDLAPNDTNDPSFLQQLVAASVPITLGTGEKKVQDLRIGGS